MFHWLSKVNSMNQNISAIDTTSWFTINECSKSYGTVYLSRGSFFRQIRMNYFAASLIFVAFENLISSSTYVIDRKYDLDEITLGGDFEGDSSE